MRGLGVALKLKRYERIARSWMLLLRNVEHLWLMEEDIAQVPEVLHLFPPATPL